jgi:hypothetical protein
VVLKLKERGAGRERLEIEQRFDGKKRHQRDAAPASLGAVAE